MNRIFILVSFSLAALVLVPISINAQDWHWQNPTPQGNTLQDIHVFDKDTSMAVGDAGTILRTTNGGTSWTAQTSGTTGTLYSVFFIDANKGWVVGELGIIVHTTNGGASWTDQSTGTPGTLYSVFFTDVNTGWVVGDNGIIFQSTNGGTNWIAQTSGSTDPLLSVFFTDASTGWAVGKFGSIVHTTNGGTNWTAQFSGTSDDLHSVYFTDANSGWAAGEAGIFHTTNGGTSWAAQSSGSQFQLFSVFFTNASTGWVVGDNGTIRHTSNGGTNWTFQSSGTTEPLHSVYFTDANTGWTVGINGTTLHTTDGGASWTPQSSGATGPLYSVFFIDANTGWAVGGNARNHDAHTFYTTNGGTSWLPRLIGSARYAYSVFFANADSGWVVGEDGTTGNTTTGGANWRVQSHTGGSANTLRSVFFIDTNSGWVVGDDGTILHSADGGISWTSQSGGTSNDLSSVFFIDTNTGWAVGSSGTILHTTNAGTSWTTQPSGTTNGLGSILFTDIHTGWTVGDNGTILHTTNAGTSWTAQSSGTTDWLTSVFFTDANTGWAVGGSSIIHHTANGGTSWTAQTTQTFNWLGSVFFTDANTGWAVGANGTILHTTTGGTGIEPPPSPMLLSPTNGSTVSTSPLLSWNPSPGAMWYSVQVSTSPFFRSYTVNETNITSTEYQLDSLVEERTFYWRVSVTTDSGTSGWSEEWSFNTPSAPGQVVLLRPGEGEIHESDNVDFLWRKSFPEVDRYWFELATDSLFASASVDSNLTDTTTTAGPLLHNQTYWWRVRAQNYHDWGEFSVARSFLVYLEVPFPPVLLAPDSGAVNVADDPTLVWNVSPGTKSYALQLSDTMDFSRLVVNEDEVRGVSFNVSGLSAGTTYYWRVNGRNDLGTSPWSEIWSFTTVPFPNQVMLASPGNGAVITGPSAVCTWSPGMPEVDRYWLEWARSPAFVGSRVDSTVTDTMSIASPLVINQTYYWRVRAHNGAGWGIFSEVWTFTVLVTDVDDENDIPAVFSLRQNYPNPFNPSTEIDFQVAEASLVKLTVCDILGRTMLTLIDAQREPGTYRAVWDAGGFPSGVYYYKLEARVISTSRMFTNVKRMILIK